MLWIMGHFGGSAASDTSAAESTMAHYGPSATCQCPSMVLVGGGGSPQPTGLYKGGQFSLRRGTTMSPQDLPPVSLTAHHSPSEISDQRLAITHPKAHLLRFNKAPRHLHKRGNVLSRYPLTLTVPCKGHRQIHPHESMGSEFLS